MVRKLYVNTKKKQSMLNQSFSEDNLYKAFEKPSTDRTLFISIEEIKKLDKKLAEKLLENEDEN